MTATVNLAPLPKQRFVDNNGVPLAGGKLFTYVAGSTTKQASYTDSTGATPNANPVILDSRGEASVWLDQTLAYKVVLAPATDSDPPTNPIWTQDGIPASGFLSFVASLLTAAGAALINWAQIGAAAITRSVLAKLREEVSADDFGADPTGASDSYAAITAAFVASPRVKLTRSGAYKTSLAVSIPAGSVLSGPNRGSATLTVTTNNPAAVIAGANAAIKNLSLRQSFGGHSVNLLEVGSVAINARCALIEGMDVQGAGQDNIAIIHGNLGSIGNTSCTSAGRDNLSFYNSTIDGNAWRSFGYIDLNVAGRDNLHLMGGASLGDATASRSHNLTISAQSATRYNVYCGSRSNLITGYFEVAGTADIFFDTYAQGNEVRATELAAVIDNSATANSNLVWNGNMAANYIRGLTSKLMLSGVSGKGARLYSDDATPGYCEWEKRGSRNFVFAVAGSGATQQTSFVNDAGGANQHVVGFGGNIIPLTTNSFTCGQSSFAWSGGFTQVAFTVTSDENTKTEIRSLDDKELAVAKALLKLPRVYKLKSSVAEKGSDKARWHSGMIAQAAVQCFVDQGLDPYAYAMNCRDPVMEGIGKPVLNADGTPKMETEIDGKEYPVFDMVGTQKIGADGQPEWLLSLRYEEFYAFVFAALAAQVPGAA